MNVSVPWSFPERTLRCRIDDLQEAFLLLLLVPDLQPPDQLVVVVASRQPGLRAQGVGDLFTQQEVLPARLLGCHLRLGLL